MERTQPLPTYAEATKIISACVGLFTSILAVRGRGQKLISVGTRGAMRLLAAVEKWWAQNKSAYLLLQEDSQQATAGGGTGGGGRKAARTASA